MSDELDNILRQMIGGAASGPSSFQLEQLQVQAQQKSATAQMMAQERAQQQQARWRQEQIMDSRTYVPIEESPLQHVYRSNSFTEFHSKMEKDGDDSKVPFDFRYILARSLQGYMIIQLGLRLLF